MYSELGIMKVQRLCAEIQDVSYQQTFKHYVPQILLASQMHLNTKFESPGFAYLT